MMEEADRIARPATTRRSLDRTCSQRKGILPRLGPNVFWWGNDHASRHAVVDVALALNPGPGVNGVCRRHVSRGCLQRTQIAADPATAVELQQCQTADLPVARRRAPRARLSRVCKGDTLTSKDYSSPRGINGYYVFNAKWSPDSQFFVYSTSSSGGHSPWSFPMMVYSRQQNRIAGFSDMINGEPTVSGDFHFADPHTRWSPARGSDPDRWMTRLRSRS